MPTSALFDFRDASFSGDPKWSKTSPHFARYAPVTVLILAALSIIEIIVGVVWITSIQSLRNGYNSLTFVQVVQPLIVPALSFFNTIPSLHLHVLARSNNPILALCFSSLLGTITLASAIVFIPPCTGSDSFGPQNTGTISTSGYQRTECPSGSRQGIWAAMIALQFVSGLGYLIHAAMAWHVRSGLRKYNAAISSGDIVELEDEDVKREREEEARRRWRAMGGL